MIDSPTFGPQFDPADGTVGRVQLLRRWALTSKRSVWPQPRAVFMYEKQAAALEHLELLQETGVGIPEDLVVCTWWCWPESICPAYLGEEEV